MVGTAISVSWSIPITGDVDNDDDVDDDTAADDDDDDDDNDGGEDSWTAFALNCSPQSHH